MNTKAESQWISIGTLKSRTLRILTTSIVTLLMILCIGIMTAFAPGPVMPEIADRMEITSLESVTGGAFLVFAGKHGGKISKSELRGQTELQVDGCARGSKIFAFTLEVNRRGKVTKFHAKSNTLTTDMVTALNSLDAGDSFEFSSTKAHLPGSKDEVEVHSDRFVIVSSLT